MRVFQGRADGRLAYRDRPLHGLRVEVEQAGAGIAVDAAATDLDGRPRLRVRGRAPLPAGAAPAGAPRSGEDEWLTPWLPAEAVGSPEGSLTAALSIRGPRAALEVQGPLALTGGRLEVPAAGVTLQEVTLRAEGRGGTISLDTLSVRSGAGTAFGAGTIRARGEVGLPAGDAPPGLGLTGELDGALLVDTRLARGRASGDFALSGTVRRPHLRADLEVADAEVWLDDVPRLGVEPVTLSEEDWAVLRERFGVLPPREQDLSALVPDALALDVSVRFERDVWIRQEVDPRMTIQLTGDVRATQSWEPGTLALEGRLEVVPGRSFVEQFARSFEVEEGVLEFRGPPGATRVELVSAYHVPSPDGGGDEVVVRLGFSGEAGDFGLTLSSEPEMETSDMVSYLATGRPATEAFSVEGGGGAMAASLGLGLVGAELSRTLERYARDGVGLDVVEIRHDGLQGAKVVAGKYVTPRLFLGVAQPVSFGGERSGGWQTEADVEFRAFQWLLANLQASGRGFRVVLGGSRGY